MLDIEILQRIAKTAYEVNRAYCRGMGDDSQPAWEDAPAWQVDSVLAGVRGVEEGRIKRPEDSHFDWLCMKVATGWSYGYFKDPEKKLHPCIVPFDRLPVEQQAKDILFFHTVRGLLAKLQP